MHAELGARTFSDVWQGTAFVLAVKLAEQGAFTWAEWTSALAESLQAGSDDDTELSYYQRLLDALEALVLRKGLISSGELAKRREAWRQAFAETPHGKPVILKRPDVLSAVSPNAVRASS